MVALRFCACHHSGRDDLFYGGGEGGELCAGQHKSPQRGRKSILNTLPIKVIARRKKPREVDFVICSRPQFARFAAASSATAGRE